MPDRAVIYARLSVQKKSGGDEQEQSDSIENQITAGTELAAREGYDLVGTYVDDGKSGFKQVVRPGFSRMLADIGKNKFDIVLVRHDDRLHRNDEEDFMWRAGCVKHGITWQTFSGTITDPRTAQGAFLAKMFAAVGQLESQIKRERLLMKNAQRRVEGTLLPQGFGWGKGGKKIPEQAEHVVWMFEHVAGGGSIGAVVRRMNDMQVPQKRTGTKWQHGTITSILENPRVAGLVPEQDGPGVLAGVVGQWDALVDPELFYAAQAARRARRPERGPKNNFSTRHLLGGIARCGVCGLELRSNGNTEAAADRASTGTYRCTYNRHAAKDGRRHVSARVDELDELARQAIVSAFFFGTGNLLPTLDEDVRADLDRVHREMAALTTEKADLVASTRDRSLGLTLADIAPSLREIQEQFARLEAEREVLREKSAAASMMTDIRNVMTPGEPIDMDSVTDSMAQLRKRLDAMHIERQRDLVRHFLDVVVMPGRGPQKYVITHKIVTSLNDEGDGFLVA